MNLTQQDIDDIFSTATDDQKKKSESEDLTVDGELFMLPSQRKKAMNQNTSKKKGQQKKRPPRQPRLTLEQILNEDSEFNDVFQFSSEKTPSNTNTNENEPQNKEIPGEQDKKNEDEQSTQAKVDLSQLSQIKQINTQEQQQQQQQQQLLLLQQQQLQQQQLQQLQQQQLQQLQQQQIIENIQKNTISSIESSLINYISTAVYSIRESFISELKSVLDNSKNEQSMIDSFLLSLPSEIDELVASEIQLVIDSNNAKTKINTFTNYIDSQLEPLQRLFPHKKSQAAVPTLENLQDDVLNAKLLMNEKYDTLINDVQSENDILNSLREKSIIFEERRRKDNPNSNLLIEAEADSKRLEIEKQFYNFRKKRLKKIQNYYKEAEVNDYSYSQTEVLLNKLSTLTRKVPQSKFKGSLSSLSSLSQNFQYLARDMHSLQKKIISETNSFVNNLSTNIENNNIDNIDTRPNDDLNNLNNYNDYDYFSSNHSKGRNKERKHKHKQFHSSRSASSRGSPESSMITDIKEQLKELRRQRIQQNQIIQENQELL